MVSEEGFVGGDDVFSGFEEFFDHATGGVDSADELDGDGDVLVLQNIVEVGGKQGWIDGDVSGSVQVQVTDAEELWLETGFLDQGAVRIEEQGS